MTKPIVVGVGGGTASGKTMICEYLLNILLISLFLCFSLTLITQIFQNIGGLNEATLFALDNFYKELEYITKILNLFCTFSDEEMKNVANINFDHPDALDWKLLEETFFLLLSGQDVVIPNYNFNTCKRDPPGIKLQSLPLIIVEGIFALYNENM